MKQQYMPLLKQTVSSVIAWLTKVVFLLSFYAHQVELKTKCLSTERLYENGDNDIGCVAIIPGLVTFIGAERKCMNNVKSGNDVKSGNAPIFVNQTDATTFVNQFLGNATSTSNSLAVEQSFFVDYQNWQVKPVNEINPSPVNCFVPSIELRDGKRKHEYLADLSSTNTQEFSNPTQVCKKFSEWPGDFNKVADEKECVVLKVDHAQVGNRLNPVSFSAKDCFEQVELTVCIRWLSEFECDVPDELQQVSKIDTDKQFLDKQSRFFFAEKSGGGGGECVRYDCVKNDVVKDRTNCSTVEQCHHPNASQLCLVGVPFGEQAKGRLVVYEPPSRGSGQSFISKSTIWVVIGGGLIVFVLMIGLVIYLVNIKVDSGPNIPLYTYRTVVEYWRNRSALYQANFQNEPVERAYSAYSSCNEVGSETSPRHVIYADSLRRTSSAGAASASHMYPNGSEYACPPSKASSTNSVTGEPPPVYYDDYTSHTRRHSQRRMDSTNSINSAGEIPPAYTSRPVSAASSLMSVLTGHRDPLAPGGSQFTSFNDIHQEENPRRCRNPSGKKVQFSSQGPQPPRQRHASDMLSSSAGASAVNAVLPHGCHPLGPTRTPHGLPLTQTRDLKPALRSRHFSEEQNRTMSPLNPIGPPVINPPPQHPGSRLLRNSTHGSGGNLLSGSSRNILNEISGESLASTTHSKPADSKSNQLVFGPQKAFNAPVRERHVSADQHVVSNRKRKDSDMVGLLDDQSPLMLAPGSDIHSDFPAVNPFIFNSQGNSDAINSSSNNRLDPVNLPNKQTGAQCNKEQLLMPQTVNATSSNQSQRFSDQDLSISGVPSIRPRSRSVTDQSRQNDGVSPNPIGSNATQTNSSDSGNIFRFGFLGTNSGSKTNVSSGRPESSDRSGTPVSKHVGAVNASYEDESMC